MVGVFEHAYLLDALLVFNEQLNSWDVYMEPRALGGALHRRVNAAVVFAANTEIYLFINQVIYFKSIKKLAIPYLISISARLLASTGRRHLCQTLTKKMSS